MKQNKVLFTGFKKAHARDVSCSLHLIEHLKDRDTFLFTNDNEVISDEVSKLMSERWDEIVMFGQKPTIKRLAIEKQAKDAENIYETNYDLDSLQKSLEIANIRYYLSRNPGNSFCNHAYCQVLKQIRAKGYDTRVVFIHIPHLSNFEQMNEVVDFFKNY